MSSPTFASVESHVSMQTAEQHLENYIMELHGPRGDDERVLPRNPWDGTADEWYLDKNNLPPAIRRRFDEALFGAPLPDQDDILELMGDWEPQTITAHDRYDALYLLLRERIGWAVPSEKAMRLVQKHASNGIIEVGAGTGYWTTVLRSREIDTLAVDTKTWKKNRWHTFIPIKEQDGAQAVRDNPERTVLIVFPCEGFSHVLRAMKIGSTLVTVAPRNYTGDDEFHDVLQHEFTKVDEAPTIDIEGYRKDLHLRADRKDTYAMTVHVKRS